MIAKLSYCLADFLSKKTGRNDTDYIRYGIDVSVSVVSKILFLTILSSLFGLLVEVMVVAFSFAFFRIFSGGIHLSTYYRCLTSTTLLFLIPVLLFKNMPNLTTSLSLFIPYISLILGLIVIFFYVPASGHNRPISKEKYRVFQLKSYIFLIFLHIIYFYLLRTQYKHLVIYSSIGILLQSFTLTPIGYLFFKTIDQIFDRRLNVKGGRKNEKSV